MNYLILLKDTNDFDKWTGEKKEGCCVWVAGSKPIITEAKNVQCSTPPWIVCAYLQGKTNNRQPTGDASEEQKSLKTQLDKMGKYRIFHHVGGLNCGVAGYSQVLEGFTNAGFVDAVFSTDNLMNCSEDGGWPWDAKMTSVKEAFRCEGANKDKFNQAINDLKEAWDMAVVYFKIEKAVEAIRQGLFPLYVDVCSLPPELPDADWQAALGRARENLAHTLADADLPESNKILEIWNSFESNGNEPFLDVAIALLETAIGLLNGTNNSSSGQSPNALFIEKFQLLSTACDERDEWLKLRGSQQKKDIGSLSNSS